MYEITIITIKHFDGRKTSSNQTINTNNIEYSRANIKAIFNAKEVTFIYNQKNINSIFNYCKCDF